MTFIKTSKDEWGRDVVYINPDYIVSIEYDSMDDFSDVKVRLSTGDLIRLEATPGDEFLENIEKQQSQMTVKKSTRREKQDATA